MPRVVVIHYDLTEAVALASRISRGDLEGEAYLHRGLAGMRGIRQNPPDAILIDLMRMPSYGRAIGGLLRETKSTRMIPLVFLEGDPEKTALVRRILPDAVFTRLPGIGDALRRAIQDPPAEPAAPVGRKTPLDKKLRIGKGSAIALLDAPEDFSLGKLPPGAKIAARADHADIVLLFVKSPAALGRRLPAMAHDDSPRKWWVLWPKKTGKPASKSAAGLSMPAIIEMCRPYGLAFHKLCAVDETWSALGIGRRRTKRASTPARLLGPKDW